MKILIDLQSCQSGSRLGGIGRYSMSLAKAMVREGTGHEFFILLNKQLPAEHEIRYQFRGLLPQHRILSFDIPSNVAEANDDVKRTRVAELVRERFIADVQPDVVHVSSLFEGLGDDVVVSVGEIFPACRTVVTLYDLIPLVERELYLTNHILENHYLRKIEYLRKAGMLLAISDYSRTEAVDFGGIADEKVVNISSAIDEFFMPRLVTDERCEALLRRCGINRKFIMYTGSFDVRKNHPRLIEAFGHLPADLKSAYQLVIVGNGWNGVYDHLRSVGRSFGLGEDALVFPGHVTDDDLLDLYNLSTLFVFPSLREGFGLPVLEAMSCGVPTIGSNVTSIPEVLGLVDAMFDPLDTSSISKKIYQALTDQEFRDVLREHALAHSKNFSWEISARKALDFIESRIGRVINNQSVDDAHSGQGVGRHEHGGTSYEKFLSLVNVIPNIRSVADKFLMTTSKILAANEIISGQSRPGAKSSLRIGWVSTWNTRCGIASYTHHLSKHTGCISRIFAPAEQALLEPDGPEVERCWSLGSANLSGLNDAIEQSGVDVVAIQMNFGLFDFPALSNLILEQKRAGRIVTITLHSTVDPPLHILNRQLADIGPALRSCDAVLVHSLFDIRNLEIAGVTENVVLFPQGVVKPPPMYSLKPKASNVFTIGTYGFFLPHKGLEQVIEAIQRVRIRGIDINLEMINAEYPASVSAELIKRCKALIKELGLQGSIRMTTEYLNEQDSLQRLAQTDMVVFAYQETGESSSAAVRMALVAGALVAVTPLPIFNDVDELVLTLPGTTVEDLEKGILSAMAMVVDDTPTLSIIQNRSRCWVESHQFSHLGHYFCNLIERFSENRLVRESCGE